MTVAVPPSITVTLPVAPPEPHRVLTPHALATKILFHTSLTAIATGFIPTGNPASTTVFTLLITEIVLSDVFAMKTRPSAEFTAIALGPAPTVIAVVAFVTPSIAVTVRQPHSLRKSCRYRVIAIRRSRANCDR